LFPRRIASADFCSSVIPANAGIQQHSCFVTVSPAPTFSLRFQDRAGSRPGRRPTFLFAQESRQRSAPRLPGPAGGGLAGASPVHAAHGQAVGRAKPRAHPSLRKARRAGR
jgi:hypothetical protein